MLHMSTSLQHIMMCWESLLRSPQQNYGPNSKYCPYSIVPRAYNRSKSLHPDKSTTTTNTAFLAMRHAYQTLLNPLKRNAYNQFGPIISQWDFPNEGDYLVRGLAWGVLPQYVISFIALQIWSLFGRGGQIKYVSPSFPPRLTGSGDIYCSFLHSYLSFMFYYTLIHLYWNTFL
jgi:hypothetical protein